MPRQVQRITASLIHGDVLLSIITRALNFTDLSCIGMPTAMLGEAICHMMGTRETRGGVTAKMACFLSL